jgi:hypothetical protein
MFPEYTVAAAARRRPPVTSRLPGDGAGPTCRPSDLPVGIRHAVQPDVDSPSQLGRALCGADVTGWALFLGLEFTGGAAADCRRCTQLVRREALDLGSGTCRQRRSDG